MTEFKPPTVCISILNWNNAHETIQCIDSLRSIQNLSFRIIVLDNGSTDNSLQILSAVINVELMTSTVNLGFAGGHNLIIKHALGQAYDYVWLLNNDATVAPECLEKLLAWLKDHPATGMVSPVIKDKAPPHANQHVLTLLNATQTGVEEYIELDEAELLQAEQSARVILWGTGLLIRRTTFEQVGLLDEQLFAYSEDTDYSLRCIHCGLLNQVVFDAVLFHHRPSGLRKAHYYYYTSRNSFLTWKKHVGFVDLLRLTRWNLKLANDQIKDMSHELLLIKSLKLGIWHGWINRGGCFNSNERLGFIPELIVRFFLAVA